MISRRSLFGFLAAAPVALPTAVMTLAKPKTLADLGWEDCGSYEIRWKMIGEPIYRYDGERFRLHGFR